MISTGSGEIKRQVGVSREQEAVAGVRWRPGIVNDPVLTAVTVAGEIVSFNIQNGRLRYRLLRQAGTQLLSLDYSPDGLHLITGDQLGNIIMTSDEYQKDVRTFKSASWFNAGHSSRLFSLKFVSDEPNVFVSGGWDGMIFLWDLRDPKPIGSIDGQKISGDTIDYKANKILAASHFPGDPIKIFDFQKRELIKTIPSVP